MESRRAARARLPVLAVSLAMAFPSVTGARAEDAARASRVDGALVSNPTDNPFEELAVAEVARLDAAAGRPEAVGPLLALLELGELLPAGRLDGAVKRLVDRRDADPLVVARARDWLARRAENTGDDAAAAALRAPLGLLSRFWVVGPLGEGRASVDVPFPPETEAQPPDVTRQYPGKDRSVRWRRAEGSMRQGALVLGAVLRPDSQAAAYALAWVRADRSTDAALRLGSPGPVKAWCNGSLVHAADRVRSARLDQDAVGIKLVAGWNRVLIKTVVTEGSWRLIARITAPDGRPLAFVNDWLPGEGATPQQVAPRSTARAPRVAVRALEAILRQRVQASQGPAARARASLDLGRYLLDVDPADRDQKQAAAAFEASARARPSVEALVALASAGREEDDARRALERALAVVERPLERARVLAALGDVARDQHRSAVSVERWTASLRAEPRWWPAAISLAGEEQTAGFPGAALARIEALPASVRAVPFVAREQARLLTALDRRVAADALRRALLPNARVDVELLRELSSAARERGDGSESLRLAARAASLRPDLPSLTIDWARALEGAGDRAGARAALEDAARRLPDEPALAAELGKLLDRAQDTDGALRWLRTSLDLRPQDPDLRRYTEALVTRAAARARAASASAASPSSSPASGRAHDELSRRFAEAVPALLSTEAARRARARGAGVAGGASAGVEIAERDPALVLLDRRAVRVHPNGLSEVFAQRVVEVLTDSGAEDNKEFLVRYTPGSEEVEILEARIFRRGPGGTVDVLQAAERDDQDLSEPWTGLYYDYRAEVVRFEGLRAGDVLEVQYLVSDVSRENQLAGYFGDLQFIAESIPKRRWDYTLLGPRDRQMYIARPAVAGLEESATDEGDERVMRFAATDVARIEPEPAMPGIGEVSPYLHVSTYASWDDVGTWYWRLVEEQLVPDDTIRRAAQAALHPAGASAGAARARAPMTDLEKVRAIHALVLGGTRYVGLEFGIHGFKPYKVSQVLARRFGDCKDKAALMVALLGEVGIDAEMVLLRTRRGGRIAPAPASLAVFDHAIVYVPKLDLYLDGTAEFSGMDELPNQDQGVMVLRVGPHGSKLVETPVLSSARNRARRRWDVRLDASGDADVTEELELTGQAAPEWREHYQTAGERMDRYAKVWTGRNPGARLLSVDMPSIEDRNRPVLVKARATVPRLAEPTADGGLLLPVGAREADLVRTYARLSERRSDLVLGYPWQHDEAITYQLPVGERAAWLPARRRIDSRFGSFELEVERQGTSTVRTRARLDVTRERVPAAAYAEFRRFLADVDAALGERVVVTAAPIDKPADIGPAPPAPATLQSRGPR